MRAAHDDLAAGTPPILGPAAFGALALVAFRVGVLPGGLVGAELLLAAAGWWVGVAASPTQLRRRVAATWHLAWPALTASVAVAIGWVLVREATDLDALVRGQALAAFGGYGNWHQLSLGPIEAHATRLTTPLQHLWLWSIVVQCAAVWWVVTLIAARVASRRPGRFSGDGAAVGGVVLGAASVLVALGMAVLGASDQALLLATPARACAFFLAAAAAAAHHRASVAVTAAAAWDLRHPIAAALVLLAVFGAPSTAVGRWSSVLLAPALATLALLATQHRPAEDRTRRRLVVALDGERAHDAWGVVVAATVLVPAVLVLGVALAPEVAIEPVVAVGALVGGAASLGLGLVAARLTDWPPSVELRRVVAPPAVVALLVVLWSVTGAFAWAAPQPRDDWPRPVPGVVGEPIAPRPGP